MGQTAMARCNADNYLNMYSLQNLGHAHLLHSLHTKNKMLSYRRETALHCAL